MTMTVGELREILEKDFNDDAQVVISDPWYCRTHAITGLDMTVDGNCALTQENQ